MESTDSEECTQKNELVDVQVDSHRLHIKIQELNVFLTGLERRYGMLKPVSEDTNILEEQFVEHQVHHWWRKYSLQTQVILFILQALHSEIHHYAAELDELNKLINNLASNADDKGKMMNNFANNMNERWVKICQYQ